MRQNNKGHIQLAARSFVSRWRNLHTHTQETPCRNHKTYNMRVVPPLSDKNANSADQCVCRRGAQTMAPTAINAQRAAPRDRVPRSSARYSGRKTSRQPPAAVADGSLVVDQTRQSWPPLRVREMKPYRVRE